MHPSMCAGCWAPCVLHSAELRPGHAQAAPRTSLAAWHSNRQRSLSSAGAAHAQQCRLQHRRAARTHRLSLRAVSCDNEVRRRRRRTLGRSSAPCYGLPGRCAAPLQRVWPTELLRFGSRCERCACGCPGAAGGAERARLERAARLGGGAPAQADVQLPELARGQARLRPACTVLRPAVCARLRAPVVAGVCLR